MCFESNTNHALL